MSKIYTSIPASGDHIVARGQTLYAIAFMYGLDYAGLAAQNGIALPYMITPGQRLRLSERRSVSTIADAGSAAVDGGVRADVPVSSRATAAVDDRWLWPSAGRVVGSYAPGVGRKGIEIKGEFGQAVYSARNGVVVYSGNDIQGYGNLLIVKHDRDYLSAYAYNSKLLVSEGDRVRVGQKIAEIGLSTSVREARLHFEIRRSGEAINPLNILPKQQLTRLQG